MDFYSAYAQGFARVAACTLPVTVADPAANAAQVVELGGSIVMPPEDTPYGRLATVTDPMGAMFKLHQ